MTALDEDDEFDDVTPDDDPILYDQLADDDVIEDRAVEDAAIEDRVIEDDVDATVDTEFPIFAPVGADPDVAADDGSRDRPTRRDHRRDVKASARRVRRVVRRIDPWSVFKVASLFVACIWGIVVLASLLIWRAAVTSGSVEDTEGFVKDIGFRAFRFDPEQLFKSLLSIGAVVAVACIFFIVLLTALFNLICDLTGGIRVTMIEQDLVDARRRRPPRSDR